jgi:major membrane immunogen (membrane-anchored lipoprotein)
MNEQTKISERRTFPAKLGKQVQSQFSQFTLTDMSAYTFEKVKSDFKSAKTDLTIFDLDGKMVLLGRDFGDRTFFWQPLPAAA